MPRAPIKNSGIQKRKPNELVIDFGVPNPKQIEFLQSKTLYTAYGGARGGGKSWAVRVKAVGGALEWEGIRILIIRRTYPELQQNHIEPILRMVPGALASYNGSLRTLYFKNGSYIKFGHANSLDTIEREYQGQEYDWIFMDEATQFCVHPDTELLLRRGWTRADETFAGDEVLSLNLDGTQEYKRIENMFIFHNQEDVYVSDAKLGAKFCVTHGHKIPVLDKVNGGWKFKEVQNIKDDYIARIGTSIDQQRVDYYEEFQHHYKGHNEVDKVPMDDWLEFLGWYLSEGSAFTRSNGNSPRISIRQTKDCPSLSALMERMPFRYSYRKDGNYLIYSGQLYDLLKPLGDAFQKRVPEYVFGLCKEQIEIFLKAFELGDGHYHNGAVYYGLCNEGLVDDLQRLYSLVGRITTKGFSEATVDGKQYDVWRLSVKQPGKYYSRMRHNIHTEYYDGLVYCPTVADNHNFVIRYHGAVSVTGNTYQDFRTLGGCLRGVNDIPKRFYLTCNPGGIGHQWVKRLFVDRDFHRNPLNPEEDENPKDYKFIPATVDDNVALLHSNGGKAYKQMLSALPEKIRQAHRFGDWNALSGAYFSEFQRGAHTCKPFAIKPNWLRYRSFDYGLDRLACYWIAVTPKGRCYIYRELCESGLIVSEAAQRILEATPDGENIVNTFAPPDVWNRQKDSGKSMAELFYLNGLPISKASNNRVQGHMQIKQMLSDMGDGQPGMIIFNTCKELINSLEVIQMDDTNPNDCAKQPHELTHSIDGIRYFAVSRILMKEEKQKKVDYDDIDREEFDYDDAMTGGEPDRTYLGY